VNNAGSVILFLARVPWNDFLEILDRTVAKKQDQKEDAGF
jgi:hypothetical protein